jgi:glycosyltransferase involved in cell wall biosynthesis
VHYNYALPYYLTRTKNVKEVHLLSGMFPLFVGGSYYLIRSRGKIRLKISKSGVNLIDSRKFVKFFEKTFIKRSALENYDVIQLNSLNETTTVLLKLNALKIFVLHGSPDYMDKTNCRFLEDLFSKVDAFVIVSAYAANKLHELCGVKPDAVLHHGVDTEIFNPASYPSNVAKKMLGIPADKKVILWNARMSPEKRLEALINALPHVVKELKNILLLVKTRAINKSYESKILKLIDKLKINKHVVFDTSWTSFIRMPVYYRAADVYVNTSIAEAFGSLTMLEAMACGTPTIANNASSNPEALGNGGLLYDNDPHDLAEKLLRVLTDNKLANLLSYKAYKRVSRELTLYQVAKKYVELYSSL